MPPKLLLLRHCQWAPHTSQLPLSGKQQAFGWSKNSLRVINTLGCRVCRYPRLWGLGDCPSSHGWIHTWAPFGTFTFSSLLSCSYPYFSLRALHLLSPSCSLLSSCLSGFHCWLFSFSSLPISHPGIRLPLSLQVSDLASSPSPCLLLGLPLFACLCPSLSLHLTPPLFF